MNQSQRPIQPAPEVRLRSAVEIHAETVRENKRKIEDLERYSGMPSWGDGDRPPVVAFVVRSDASVVLNLHGYDLSLADAAEFSAWLAAWLEPPPEEKHLRGAGR